MGRLVLVMMNRSPHACDRQLTAPGFRMVQPCEVHAVASHPDTGSFFNEFQTSVAQLDADCLEIRCTVPSRSVCSIVVEVNSASGSASQQPRLTAAKLVEFARCAAEATVAERMLGEADNRTRGAWARLQHFSAVVSESHCGQELIDLVMCCAWGV